MCKSNSEKKRGGRQFSFVFQPTEPFSKLRFGSAVFKHSRVTSVTHRRVLAGKLGIPWDAGVEMPTPGRHWCRGIGEVLLGRPAPGRASAPDVRCCLGAGSSGSCAVRLVGRGRGWRGAGRDPGSRWEEAAWGRASSPPTSDEIMERASTREGW